jgi:LPXTG-motif cell wall-anchored protein
MRSVRFVLAATCAATLLLGFSGRAGAGAGPVANDDNASTPQDTAVDIDVLANDSIPAEFILQNPAVVIESDPLHGTATVKPDGRTIHYVPDAGFTGGDDMEYLICAVFQGKTQGIQCNSQSIADVLITVTAVAPTTTTTDPPTTTSLEPLAVTTTVAPAAATTSVAAAANTLPQTGSGSTPLGVVGIVSVAAGGAALLASKRARRRSS